MEALSDMLALKAKNNSITDYKKKAEVFY